MARARPAAAQHQGYQQGRPARQQQFEDHADHHSGQAQHQRRFIHFAAGGCNRCDETVQCGGLAGQSPAPSRLGNWPMAITTAAPRVKPSTTECETKFTRAPKRSKPSSHWKIPASKVSNRISGDVVLRRRNGQRTDAGVQDNRNGRRRTADQMPRRTPQAGDQHRDDRGIEAVLGWEAGNQCVGDGLRQRENRAAEADDQVASDAGAGLPG